MTVVKEVVLESVEILAEIGREIVHPDDPDRLIAIEEDVVVVVPVHHVQNSNVHGDVSVRCTGMFHRQVGFFCFK